MPAADMQMMQVQRVLMALMHKVELVEAKVAAILEKVEELEVGMAGSETASEYTLNGSDSSNDMEQEDAVVLEFNPTHQ